MGHSLRVFCACFCSLVFTCGIQLPTLETSSFCEDSLESKGTMFPHEPLDHSMPWVWDAILDPVKGYIEVTTFARRVCRYNIDDWYNFMALFPEYLNQFAYGSMDNILVPVNISIGRLSDLFFDKSKCLLFHNDHLLYQLTPLPLQRSRIWAADSSIQIRFKIPQNVSQLSNITMLLTLSNGYKNLTTNRFSVCRISMYKPKQKRYKLSICSATSRTDRPHMVEWIEYHRLLGVQHFFIYDTSNSFKGVKNSSESTGDRGGHADRPSRMHHTSAESLGLKNILSDYISKQIVTVVPWHWANCALNMASGRRTVFKIPNGTEIIGVFFKPPAAIAQTSALASCYSRFRHTSTYMTHIDDDEFIVISPALSSQITSKSIPSRIIPTDGPRHPHAPLFPGTAANASVPAGVRGSTTLEAPAHSPERVTWTLLTEYIEHQFSKNPRAPALRLNPVGFLPCNFSSLGANSSYARVLNATSSSSSLNSSISSVTSNSSQAAASSNIFATLYSSDTTYGPQLRSQARAAAAAAAAKGAKGAKGGKRRDTSLPRLDNWEIWQPMPDYESKLIMKTEDVAMFYIHYLVSFEAGARGVHAVVRLPLGEAALYHYRMPGELSGVIYGSTIPLSNTSFVEECRRIDTMYAANATHVQPPEDLLRVLRKRVDKKKTLKKGKWTVT